jgi:hypothetical protein
MTVIDIILLTNAYAQLVAAIAQLIVAMREGP